MDVSAEAADLVVKESLQATESAAKLLGSGVKNVAALLLAIAKDNYKVVGKTNSKAWPATPPRRRSSASKGGYGAVSEAGQGVRRAVLFRPEKGK